MPAAAGMLPCNLQVVPFIMLLCCSPVQLCQHLFEEGQVVIIAGTAAEGDVEGAADMEQTKEQ